MATKPTPKKKPAKAATGLQKKYNELKAANTSMFDANKILSEKLEEAKKKLDDHESKAKNQDCVAQMPLNEFQAADKIVDIFASLSSSFHRKVVLATVLSSLIERQRAELSNRKNSLLDHSREVMHNSEQVKMQEKGIDEMKEIIHNFAHS